MKQAITLALVRQLVTVLGVLLAGYGITLDGSTTEAVAGGLAALASVLWSVADKVLAARKATAAAAA